MQPLCSISMLSSSAAPDQKFIAAIWRLLLGASRILQQLPKRDLYLSATVWYWRSFASRPYDRSSNFISLSYNFQAFLASHPIVQFKHVIRLCKILIVCPKNFRTSKKRISLILRGICPGSPFPMTQDGNSLPIYSHLDLET